MEKIVERYQDLYFYIKSKLNTNIVLNLEKSEYVDDFEITGEYKNKNLSIRDLENDSLVLDYDGKIDDLENTIVPMLSEYLGKNPICRYDVVDFQSLNRLTYRVEWNVERLDEIKDNNIIDNLTIVRNIYLYDKEKDKELIKKW